MEAWELAMSRLQWLSFVLSQFPYTRPWGESLNVHLPGTLARAAKRTDPPSTHTLRVSPPSTLMFCPVM